MAEQFSLACDSSDFTSGLVVIGSAVETFSSVIPAISDGTLCSNIM